MAQGTGRPLSEGPPPVPGNQDWPWGLHGLPQKVQTRRGKLRDAVPHCNGDKTPEHIFFCPKSLGVFRDWPWPNKARRRRRPLTTEARRLYLKDIMAEP